MGNKKKKNKKKKVNPKRERYAKFRKEKPSNMSFTTPADITDEQQKQRQKDEDTISYFLRGVTRYPRTEIVERRVKSKR